jgi:thiol:disulfide interchange protein DsbD
MLAVTALLTLRAAGAAAQEGGAMPAADQLVRPSAAPVTIPAGGRAVVRVRLEVIPGWHVNANPPTLDYNIPTEVSLAGAHGLTPGAARYPRGKQQKFSFEDTPLLVYDGTAEVTVPLTAGANATSGTLAGTVRFQGCNDQLCLQPASVPFEVQVTVTAAAAAPALTAADSVVLAQPEPAATARDSGTFTTAPPAAGDPTGQRARLESALAGGGVGWFLALFLGGLLLNLTPCVFPMVGVTVSIFGARRREALPKAMTSAVLYVLGICLTYTVLGVIAALTGGLFGAALQNVWVMVALGGAMILLSLGMFGVYEMQPPLWVMNRLGGASATNFAGAFLSGLGVGIIAAPCVGPFVVAVLALIAQRGDVGFGLGTMFTLSLGLGFPYLFLATFSNLLTALPKSGDWMVWVKHVFGAIMIAFGLYFISLGVAPALTPWVLPVALVAGGILLGFVDPSAGPRGRVRAFAQSLGLLALVAGIVPATMMVQAQMRTLTFQPYDPAAVQASLAAGRPVMMDFSADWCIPCHEMEVTTLSDPRVVAAARRFDRYKVDLTKYDSPEAEASRRRYAITGVPTVVFLGSDGQEIAPARVEGYLAAEPFLARLRMGETR